MSEELTLTQDPPRRKRRMRAKAPQQAFAGLPPTPWAHFRLYWYAAVLDVLEQVTRSFDTREEALAQFPFLVNYHNALADFGLAGIAFDQAATWWNTALQAWEEAIPAQLPLCALRDGLGLEHDTLTLLVSIGLIEEDARFGALYEALHGIRGQHRPIVALLNGWRQSVDGEAQRGLRRLIELGLVQAINPDAPRLEWALQVPAPIWDALRGEAHAMPAPGVAYRAPDQLLTLDELTVPETLRSTLTQLPTLLASGEAQTLIVRGPQHNGRHTLVGAMARAMGRRRLDVDQAQLAKDDQVRLIGPLAILLNAMPCIELDLAPGETAEISRPIGYTGPIGLVLGKHGGVNSAALDRALTITLDMPDQTARRQHWLRGSHAYPLEDVDTLAGRFRLTSGNIQRAAQIAQVYARLNGRQSIALPDAQQASRALNRQALDTLAVRLETTGGWIDLSVGADTMHELHNLETRCRHREQLRGSVSQALGAHLNCGVRALFTGPSGTGKTLAARLLAAVLQMDLYRLDLSSIVNKYIGETEKNLNQVFSRAEELDVILLLDEGDALLTQRTNVHTSNDRYANLETNFLLQRLETFEGILIVTTNAGDRIDGAFQRRMDVVVDFRPPDISERWSIWQLHLPPEHAIDPRWLHDVVARCALTGGQIRNAVLHASLLALNDGGVVKDEYLEDAVHREYRKIGAVCPLRAKSR